MSITRRHFLLGIVSGVPGMILPGFHDRALAHLANHGEPLLERPKTVRRVLRVFPDYDWLLSFGDEPVPDPPKFTWREAFEDWLRDEMYYYIENHELTEEDLDDEADEELLSEKWNAWHSPNAQAARWLEGLEVGVLSGGRGRIGGIRFEDDTCMGGGAYLRAHARNDQSVALLQHHLNRRRQGVEIVLAA